MDSFEQARENMVESQLRPADVTDRRILDAMADIPREQFLPTASRAVAYCDDAVSLGGGRALMQPRVFAKLLQLAAIRSGDLVLDVGCATGYSSAVLARLTDAVVAVEEDDDLAARANDLLPQLDAGSVAVVTAPLNQGYPSEGPYDAIVLNGSVEEAPETLLAQLKDGGRLVAVIADNIASKAYVFLKTGETVSSRNAFDASAPPLPGFQRAPEFVF